MSVSESVLPEFKVGDLVATVIGDCVIVTSINGKIWAKRGKDFFRLNSHLISTSLKLTGYEQVALLSYNEVLLKIEKMMNESGIRDLCTLRCKGKCCDRCYSSANACHKNEGRRLACSIYICEHLTRAIAHETAKKLGELRAEIITRICACMPNNESAFFSVNTPEVISKFNFPEELLYLHLPAGDELSRLRQTIDLLHKNGVVGLF